MRVLALLFSVCVNRVCVGGRQCAMYMCVFTLVHTAHSAPGVTRQKPIFSRGTDGRNPSAIQRGVGGSDVTREFAPFKYPHRLPTVSHPPTQSRLAGCSPLLRRKNKTKFVDEKYLQRARMTLGMKVLILL